MSETTLITSFVPGRAAGRGVPSSVVSDVAVGLDFVTAVLGGKLVEGVVNHLLVVLGVEFAVGFAPEDGSPVVVVGVTPSAAVGRDPSLFLPNAVAIQIVPWSRFFRAHASPSLGRKSTPHPFPMGGCPTVIPSSLAYLKYTRGA